MFPISPIIEESTTNTPSLLKESMRSAERLTASVKAIEVTNELEKLEKIIDEKTTPKRSLNFERRNKEHFKYITPPSVITNSSSTDDIKKDKTLIKAAIELDEDNEILDPSAGIVTDFSISEKVIPYKNDKNARFFSYDDVKKIDDAFEIPSSSYVDAVSPKIYINSTSTFDSTLEDINEDNNTFNTTMIEDTSEIINQVFNGPKDNGEEKKVTFAEELVKIDDVREREEVSIVHDYYYYSDDEQTVIQNYNDNNYEKSCDDSSETNVSLSEESSKDIKEAIDDSFAQTFHDTYDPLDLIEDRQSLNTSFASSKTAFEISSSLTPKNETDSQSFFSSTINKNYEDLKNESITLKNVIVELKKNQENMLEMMNNIIIENKNIINEATQSREELIKSLKDKIFELETELDISDKEIIDCCNRATHYRRIYLELAVEVNKITVEDAVGQMNDPLYKEEYFEKFKKISNNEIKKSFSSIDVTNKRITIEKLDKSSSNNSTLRRISSFLSPRKCNT